MDDGLLELTADAKIIYANTAAPRLLGLVEEKLLSAFFPDFFPAEQRQLVIESLGRQDCSVARIGEEPPIILHGNNLLIKFVPFFDQGRKFIITMIHNITRRKQAELALRQHDETLAELDTRRRAYLLEYLENVEQAILTTTHDPVIINGPIHRPDWPGMPFKRTVIAADRKIIRHFQFAHLAG